MEQAGEALELLREQARSLRAEGRPDLAYLALQTVVLADIADPMTAATVAAETQICLLDHDRKAPPAARLVHFFTSQMLFHQAVARVPGFPVPYRCQAELWRRLGDLDMARRVLRTLQAIAPTPAGEAQLASYAGRESSAPSAVPDPPPGGDVGPLRVLVVTHPRPDYGLDVLCDGLRTLLGADRVVEYPWKPSLHGQPPPDLAYYPCLFDHPGRPVELDNLLAELRQGRFDAVLYGDVERKLDRDTARRILDAAGETPWAIVDQADDPIDRRIELLEHVGRSSCPACFKRELLACHDYGPGVYPLPFAYPDSRIPARVGEERPRALFWAGHRQFGLRRPYLEHLEARLGLSLDQGYGQAEYAAALAGSRVGLSLFGAGFDTVRYWELPAHGCLLFAERPPIRIPFNFEDGQSAVFFDDLGDLGDRLESLLRNPGEARRIASEGHERLRRYHTASARATQLLARLLG